MDLKRFSRQIIIQDFGLEGQYILSQSKVLIIGLGGLGSVASMYLAIGGIGKLGLVDFDKVDLTNLQRQPLYRENDVGNFKVEIAKKNLLEYNSNLHIEIYKHFFSYDQKEIVKEYDLILDCTDNIATRKLINQVSLEYQIPFLYCSLDQFSFQIALLNVSNGPCFDCLYPNLEDSQLMNCVERGILGPIAGIAGIYQALEAMKFLVSLHYLKNEILYVDLLSHKSLKLQITKNPNCKCNHYKFLNTKQNTKKEIHIPKITIKDLTSLETFTLIQLNDTSKIDIRSLIPENLRAKIKKIDLKELPYKIQEISKKETIVVMCQSGIRAKQGAKVLKELEFHNVYYLQNDFLL